MLFRSGTHSLIATGGNDGSVGVTRLKWSDDYADSLRLVAVNGKARVNRRAHPGGAVRGVAFLNPTSVISAGGGDYSPRVWDLGAAGASMPDECTRVLRPHGSEIVGVCADWGSFAGAGSTENFASTASRFGDKSTDEAMKYVKDNGGLDLESDYQYEAANGKCNLEKEGQHHAFITGHTDVPQNNEAQLEAAVTKGPVSEIGRAHV